jgi:hypothetical protein
MKSITFEEFIKKANKVHNNKYTYLNYTVLSNKLTIVCPIHGPFEQSGYQHLKGKGCRKCVHDSLRFSQEYFIERANKVHNNKYDYSKTIYNHSHELVTIICDKHGEFQQIAREHLKGHGCRKCARCGTTEEFIERANKVHNNKYDYSKTNYVGRRTKLIIICPIHGEFEQTPEQHLLGSKCSKCVGRVSTTEEFIVKANRIHNNKYDYSKTNYVSYRTKLIIICPIHGEFEQTPERHLIKSNCPKCASGPSKKSQQWLDSLNIPVECREQTLKIGKKNYRVDAFYNNVVYEFNGDFWHGNPDVFDPNEINPMVKKSYGELYNQTIKKEKEIITAGYKIVSIWENDFNEIC